jgi:hypothetical protein
MRWLLGPSPWLGARPSPRRFPLPLPLLPRLLLQLHRGAATPEFLQLRTLRCTHRTWSHARLLSSRGHLAHWRKWNHLVVLVLRKPTYYFAGIRGARSAHAGQLLGWVVWCVLEREGSRWRSKPKSKSKSKSKSDPSWTSKQVQVQSQNPNKVRVGLRSPSLNPSPTTNRTWTSSPSPIT